MPLVGYHTGDPGNSQSNNAAFPKFEDDTIAVAAAHPQTTFIFAHVLNSSACLFHVLAEAVGRVAAETNERRACRGAKQKSKTADKGDSIRRHDLLPHSETHMRAAGYSPFDMWLRIGHDLLKLSIFFMALAGVSTYLLSAGIGKPQDE